MEQRDAFTKNDMSGITGGPQIIWPDNSKNLVYSASNKYLGPSKTPDQTSSKIRALCSSQKPVRVSGKRNIVELTHISSRHAAENSHMAIESNTFVPKMRGDCEGNGHKAQSVCRRPVKAKHIVIQGPDIGDEDGHRRKAFQESAPTP